jgi:hypothetical protein
MRRILGRRQDRAEKAQICGIASPGFSVEQIIMPVTLPHCDRGGGGPGCHGGRDGRCDQVGRGGPLPCRKCNPMLASILRNSTLTTSISALPCTPAPSAAVPSPPPAVAGPQYTTAIVQVQNCGNPRGAYPSSRQTTASHGPGKKEKRGDETTEEGGRQTTVSPSAALLSWEGKGLTVPPLHPLPFLIIVSPG